MTTNIEWTDETWNPVTGCTKVSAGCKNCYAERMWTRLSAKNMPYHGRKFTDVMCHPDRLYAPLHWKKPRKVFVNSMSDLFHEDVPFNFIREVFLVMQNTRHHTYQILTKRPERMIEFFHQWYTGIDDNLMRDIYPHVWLGVSVENQETADERIPLLLDTPAAVRWISAEPLIGPIDFYESSDHWYKNGYTPWRNAPILTDIHWIVVGGESGPKARPMDPAWARRIRDQCINSDVPFYFKQWGEYRYLENSSNDYTRVGKNRAGRVLDGESWSEYPCLET